MSTDPHIVSFHQETDKILTHLLSEYGKLQTGRANAALVEHVDIEAYGQRQPLKTIAGISIQDARTIVIQPWDKSILSSVETALQKADIGISPMNDGVVIRVTLPSMTEERRTQLKKVVHTLAEEARISVRQKRQDTHDVIKENTKDEDEKYSLLEILQKAVEDANKKIEDTMKKKEVEIMTV
ncbi:ribosome recycling factor [Candidatus Peribacteria bacterium RIFCSPHIGHO2_01_FULL_51_9]|nr:MAG: ribosome recycling factor [Candidatus Peribacteria bacterium RIFCSPHIGHO2_01_FULL_51_9]